MSLCRSALLAAALLLVAPAAAQAAAVSLSGATLSYVAAEGEANDLSVSLAEGVYTLTDAAGEPVTAGAGCLQVLPAQATCPSAGITLLSLDARDRADVIHIGPGTANTTLTGARATTSSPAATAPTRSTAAPTPTASTAARESTRSTATGATTRSPAASRPTPSTAARAPTSRTTPRACPP